MIRLYIVVEGLTEETFANEVLAPYLKQYDVFITPISLGGRINRNCARLINRLEQLMERDRRSDARFSMMVDFYALADDCPTWQDREKSRSRALARDKVSVLEQGFANKLKDTRFVPYLQLHEFEALLFTKPEKFLIAYPTRSNEISELKKIRMAFDSPEEINESRENAPSKRIERVLPDYDKVVAGALIAMEIGLPALREANPHFSAWLGKLEQFSPDRSSKQ